MLAVEIVSAPAFFVASSPPGGALDCRPASAIGTKFCCSEMLLRNRHPKGSPSKLFRIILT
jgi:hypothetical protein